MISNGGCVGPREIVEDLTVDEVADKMLHVKGKYRLLVEYVTRL